MAASTASQHGATAAEFLEFLHLGRNPKAMHQLEHRVVEAFVRRLGRRLSRATLQHAIARLRSFLRFLASRGALAPGIDIAIDTPRVYRGEQLPQALSWELVRAFLAGIDRSTPVGRRDYAMLLLVATYGLRIGEVTCLRLDDIEWRAGRLRVGRPKSGSPLILPLTEEVGAALLDYLRHARPELPNREVFLRVRMPAGPLKRTAVNDVFAAWRRRSALPIPPKGPHCLRHSLAVHLLREGASLKAIGDLLGHRSLESTCVYLRLHVDDLRDAALELPVEGRL
jgi:site-specific recombinase XerD